MSLVPTRIPLGPDDAGRRLDRILRRLLPEQPLSRVYALLRKGDVRVNGRRRSGSYRVREGDVIEMPPSVAPEPAVTGDAAPSTVGLSPELARRIVYENEHLLALDKPAGAPVHGPHGLLATLKPYLERNRGEGVSFRAGPIHRLDRNTSGLILFPKSVLGARRGSRLLREGRLAKGYVAVLAGRLDRPAGWEDELLRDRRRNRTLVAGDSAVADNTDTRAAPEGSELRRLGRAVTRVRPLWEGEKATLALIAIETGRTHQIRAQAGAHGTPLLGDGKYGGRRGNVDPTAIGARRHGRPRRDGYLLHAAVIRNCEPDEVLPLDHLCAPPDPRYVHSRLGAGIDRAEVARLLACPTLLEEIAVLLGKQRP
ncbi:MAG: RluA family pseudouridine synthase [Spirochaetaceae bacterium]